MPSPWKTQPEAVADKVLKRAEVSKVSSWRWVQGQAPAHLLNLRAFGPFVVGVLAPQLYPRP